MKEIRQSILLFARNFLSNYLNTCEPGEILTYDSSTRRANVQPLLLRTYEDSGNKKRAPLLDVPVVQPSSGGFIFHMEVKKGDIVLLVYSKGGIEGFKKNWGIETVVDEGGNFSLSNSFALICGPPAKDDSNLVSDKGIVLQSKNGNSYIHLTDEEIRMKVGDGNARLTSSNWNTWRGR